MSVLEVRRLSGGYTNAPVLRGIELHVASSEFVGLLGANGSGKTTLLRALSGVLPVCSGSVTLDGVELRNRKCWDRARAGLAHVPQGRRVFGAMSVRDNLEVSAGRGHHRRAFEEVFHLFPRLEERQRQSAGSLSGGEQQMLAIACGLMMNPKVIICDELSAGLAPVVVEQLIAGLNRLRVSGTAILLVEQSPQFIVDAVDRVYLLEQGRVVDEGTFEALGGPGALAERYLGVR